MQVGRAASRLGEERCRYQPPITRLGRKVAPLHFSSSLYLGFLHPSSSLEPWDQLSAGTPAALGVPARTSRLQARLGALLGCARATVAPSTLHVFWDLFVVLGAGQSAIVVDDGAYPIARWGVERAAARGAIRRSFAHHDAGALEAELGAAAAYGRRPIVLVDGLCPMCGPAPLVAYRALVDRFGGVLVIDDTQGVGILGDRHHACPFGMGGGGSARYQAIGGPNVVIGASLAKGFGVPIAVLTGDDVIIRRFERDAGTRVHCSQPSVAALRAATRALDLNSVAGDSVRSRLAALITRFRGRVADAGYRPRGPIFPVQTVLTGRRAPRVHVRLRQAGVESVLHTGHRGEMRLTFVVNASHRAADVDAAAAALRRLR
jgi:8-amino-7-oxononanoate synthase